MSLWSPDKRILILSSNTGGGHRSAALALEDSLLRQSGGGLWVTISQVMEEANGLTNACAGFYNYLLRNHQHYMKYYYAAIEHLKPYQNNLLFESCSKYGAHLFSKFGPNVLVSVHPMMQHFMAYMLRKLKLVDKIPLITVVTDPYKDFWRGWACDDVQQYFVASPEAKTQLESFGVESSRIEVTGMPVHNKFQPCPSLDHKHQLKQSLGLSQDRFTVLVNAGWVGGGNIPLFYETLIQQAPKAMQFIFIAGHNQDLLKQTESFIPAEEAHRFKVMGFTDHMETYMQASDVILSKLGGLTTFEAMACHLPILADCLTPPMPQEMATAEYIDTHGAGVLIQSPDQLLQTLDQLVSFPDRYGQLKQSAANLGRPGAVDTIAKTILSYT